MKCTRTIFLGGTQPARASQAPRCDQSPQLQVEALWLHPVRDRSAHLLHVPHLPHRLCPRGALTSGATLYVLFIGAVFFVMWLFLSIYNNNY